MPWVAKGLASMGLNEMEALWQEIKKTTEQKEQNKS